MKGRQSGQEREYLPHRWRRRGPATAPVIATGVGVTVVALTIGYSARSLGKGELPWYLFVLWPLALVILVLVRRVVWEANQLIAGMKATVLADPEEVRTA